MMYGCLKTKREINGYKYERILGRKSWTRGRTMFSEGRYWMTQNNWVMVITKTDLDTHEISLASLKEAKRFLTEEGYNEYVNQQYAEAKKYI